MENKCRTLIGKTSDILTNKKSDVKTTNFYIAFLFLLFYFR